MIKAGTYLLLLMIALGHMPALCQDFPAKIDFGPPLPVDLLVTGTFAEIRPNHFHSGIDFKVGQKTGMPVLAVAEGFVSRVKVSEIGFGRALYIDHPNGLTSVYAHLEEYSDTLLKRIRAQQYKGKSFAMDWFPAHEGDTLFVRKGDTIGYAGNSGSSQGPHLHFEIRTTSTERILNPLRFGYRSPDVYAPFMDAFMIYPQDPTSFAGNNNFPDKAIVTRTGEEDYKLSGTDTLRLWGRFSFGVQAFDYMYSQGDRNGWYSLDMSLDGQPFFRMQQDSFAFDESRYVNACIDFRENYRNGSRMIRSQRLPGNFMSTFRTFGNDGIIELMDGEAHLLLVTVADFEGHKSVLKVPVLSRYPGSIVSVPMADPVGNAMDLTWNRENRIVYDELDLVIPQGALYEDITFIYSKSPRAGWSYSGLYSLHQPEVPLHKGLKVKLDAGQLPARLKSKACLVRVDDNGRRHYAGGSFKDGFVSGSPTVFGTYAIGVDTLKPVIKKIGDKSKKKSSIRFTVTDNFSGIGSYSGELNGQWVLVEFDPKNDLMIYRFDENLLSGKNQFKLTVTDNKGNKAAYSTTINGK